MSQTETQHPEASLSVPQRPARSESISAMLSGRMLLLSASCWLLVVLGSSKELIEKRSPGDTAIKTQEEEELTWMETVRDTGLVGGVIQPQGGLVGGVIQPQGGLVGGVIQPQDRSSAGSSGEVKEQTAAVVREEARLGSCL
ncbi:uncharacterized protein LOC126397096 isoform X2 [Epinephelus moara]|uniref:uncharacterized protein LOC126397096 isoform X2 n=1 Tax=Epinephelus moara TaxID=300413 RepID=UPI00214E7AE7|nr:uncharacterized protein LOC126397096 isoform X2 [Epinephelus moara]